MAIKAVAYIAVGVALGFALGGIPARRELAAAHAERDALEARLDDLTRPSLLQAFLPGLSEAARPADGPARTGGADDDAAGARAATRGGELAPPPGPRGDVAVIGAPDHTGEDSARAQMEPSPAAPSTAGEAQAARPSAADGEGDDAQRGRRAPRQLLARFDQLVAAQRARSAAARSALAEHAELDQAELQRVDSAVTRMNGKLAGYGEEVIAQVASEEPPSPAQALGLGHDVSGILFEAQKELDAVVGERAEGVDPSAVEIWNYVDVEQWRPHVEQALAARDDTQTAPAQPSAPAGESAAGSGAAPAAR